MRELFRDLVEHLGLTVDVDQWSGIALAMAEGQFRRMEIQDDDDDEMWEFDDIFDEFDGFCGE